MSFLRKIRKDMGKTQIELAEMIGAAQSTITRLENDERQMSREWAVKLSEVTGISPVLFVFPDEEYRTDAELAEIIDGLSRLSAEDRKVALNILRPFIAAHVSS